ncbi:hypothetical protein COY95_03285, partial [Candidatus Woesearchaeota archaeon CG_4_10_14_0_8_um_filter_47_5]
MGRKHPGEEEKKQETWIVFKELNVDPHQKNDYYSIGDEITVHATLLVSILKIDEDRTIVYGCSFEGANLTDGPDPPKNLLSDLVGIGETVRCTFQPQDTGQKTINVSVRFGFSTEGYSVIWFMDREHERQVVLEGKDIVAEYGMDKESTSVYSGGPLEIGIKRFEMPYSVRADGSTSTIGFTFTNKKEGQILAMNDIIITLPREITFEPDFAACPLIKTGDTYHLNTTRLGRGVTFPLRKDDYFTITCKMKIDQDIVGDI